MFPICVGLSVKALVACFILPFAAGAVGDVSRQSKTFLNLMLRVTNRFFRKFQKKNLQWIFDCKMKWISLLS